MQILNDSMTLTVTEPLEQLACGFTMDDINIGDSYKPLDVYFKNAAGEVIRCSYTKGERKIPTRPCRVSFPGF